MARTIDSIVKEQLGELMMRLAVLTAELEAAREENAALKASARKPESKDSAPAKVKG